MMNKKWILTFTALASLNASATLVDEIQTLMRSSIRTQAMSATLVVGDNVPKPVAIRQAKMKVNVNKTTVTKGTDGNYQFINSPVCAGEVSINVYDLRNSSSAGITEDDLNGFSCSTTLLGKSVSLKIGGILMLSHGTLFDLPEDFKVGVPLLWFGDQSAGTAHLNAGTVLGSRDINSHSMLGFLQPMDLWTCKDSGQGSTVCDPTLNEYFSATVDLQD